MRTWGLRVVLLATAFVVVICNLSPRAGHAQPPADAAVALHAERFQCLAAAYPDLIVGLRAGGPGGRGTVELRGGRQLPWDDGVARKTAEQQFESPDLEDMVATLYPVGDHLDPPG